MKYICKTLIFMTLIYCYKHEIKAQVYVGGGFVYASLSPSGLDDVTGFGVEFQKEINSEDTRFVFSPTVRFTMLNSTMYRDANAFYANSLSFSSILAYKVIDRKRFSISPYAAPFAGWLLAIRFPDAINFAGYRDEMIYGLEFGLEFQVALNESLAVKINPITLQFGDNNFRQGMISVLFRLAK